MYLCSEIFPISDFQSEVLLLEKVQIYLAFCLFIRTFAPALGLRKQSIGNGVRVPDCPAAVSSINEQFIPCH